MDDRALYQAILVVPAPWQVERVGLRPEPGEVEVWVAAAAGTGFACPACDAAAPTHDHVERRWRHLDTCQFRTLLCARVPRAEAGARFTALFKRLAIAWLRESTPTAVAPRLALSWEEARGIMTRAVRRGLARHPPSVVPHLGIDEKSVLTRHQYVSVVVDLDRPRILHVADDGKAVSLDGYFAVLGAAQRAGIAAIAMDMWEAYRHTVRAHVPDADAKIVFDTFHVLPHVSTAVDPVRKQEHQALLAVGDARLTRTKYAWFRNPVKFSTTAWREFAALRTSTLPSARAWAMKESLRRRWDDTYVGAARTLTIGVEFRPGSRFASPEVAGEHPVHDTRTRRCRHLNVFQHECFLEVRVPRAKLPDGSVRLAKPPWAGQLGGFTPLFEALVLGLGREMPLAAVARLVGGSWHRVAAIAERYAERALAAADHSPVRELAIDETSRARGHDHITIAADAERRAVILVTETREAAAIEHLAEDLRTHGGPPAAIRAVSVAMSPACINGVAEPLPDAAFTFDKFHVIAQASHALDLARRAEPKRDPALKGLRWTLLQNSRRLSGVRQADLEDLLRHLTAKRTVRAWQHREDLREILSRQPTNLVSAGLTQWCTNVLRSKVEPMKAVARMIRTHLEGIVAWARTRRTNGFLEALIGLFQAATRKARGYRHLSTIRTIRFLIAGTLDFRTCNPQVA